MYGTATIRGIVKFTGEPPKRDAIANQPCHAGAKPLLDEKVVVNENKTLANVFVYLASASASDGSDREAAVLDQVSCQYVPHAIGVQVGQTLRIKSSDPTMHNVHYDPKANTPANFGQTVVGAEKAVRFENAEFIRVRCDVHPWMAAYIGVFDSPFFGVTNATDGSFEIAKVPAGKYVLTAWHEQYGKLEQSIEVKTGEVVRGEFEFKPQQ